MDHLVKAKDRSEAAIGQAIAELEYLAEEDVLINPGKHINAYMVAWETFIALLAKRNLGDLDECVRIEDPRNKAVPKGSTRVACVSCTKRRSKCNKKVPECGACQERGLKCVKKVPPTVAAGLTTMGEVWQSKVQEVVESRWMNEETAISTGVQPPYKFLSNLDIEDSSSIRHVMEYLRFKFAGFRGDQIRVALILNTTEKRESQRIWMECDGNGLLHSKLQWFAGHYKDADRKIDSVVRHIQEFATYSVRHPEKYKAEYEANIERESKQITSSELKQNGSNKLARQGGSRGKQALPAARVERTAGGSNAIPEAPEDRPVSNLHPGHPKATWRTQSAKAPGEDEQAYPKIASETEIDDEESSCDSSPTKHNVFLQTVLPGEGRTTRSGRPYNAYSGEIYDTVATTMLSNRVRDPNHTQLVRANETPSRSTGSRKRKRE